VVVSIPSSSAVDLRIQLDGSIYEKYPPNLKKIATKGFSTDFGTSELP